jgi:hypothetical protein
VQVAGEESYNIAPGTVLLDLHVTFKYDPVTTAVGNVINPYTVGVDVGVAVAAAPNELDTTNISAITINHFLICLSSYGLMR